MAGNHRSGRKRKPTALKILEGSFRKDRHAAEPQVVGGFPEAPEGLSEGERQLWETFPRVPWIVQSDRIALHGAVSLYARILSNQQRQREMPEEAIKLVRDEAQLWGRLQSLLGSLGLTPADRAKMRAPKMDEADDKWAGLL